jgi:crotonobetainyl-CoA:carnitine CoA-transferase CaiB-like acyl-CoA transferase
MSEAEARRTGPLADVRILDCTQALAGPFGTMLLADLGADVIKVEPPRGDLTRLMAPIDREAVARGADFGGYFASINRNKRSIVLDLRLDEDRARFLELVPTVDAVVENSRVGVMDRLGVGYEALRAVNPRLVYAAIRGFGDPRTGRSPYADWPAFDIVAQCMGGLVGITGPIGSTGYPTGASVGDIFPGAIFALGVVSAIHAARRTGEGQFLDVAMMDAMIALCETVVVSHSYSGKVLGPRGAGHPTLCPFDVYETSDGAVSIAAPTEHHWRVLCEKIGRADLADDERTADVFRRSENRAFVTEVLSAWTKVRTKHQVCEILGGVVPVGPVQSAADLADDPHVAIRGMRAEVELPDEGRTIHVAGVPTKLTGTPAGVYRRPPRLGEHGEEILAEARALAQKERP